MKQLQKKKKSKPDGNGNGNGNGESAFVIIEAVKFKTAGERTTPRQDLRIALEIRAFQRITRLSRCDVELLKKEMTEKDVHVSYSGGGVPERSIRKPNLQEILGRLLSFLKPETFQGAIKAINERIISVLDDQGMGRVYLGLFYAVLGQICGGPLENRKRVAYDSLLWRSVNEGNSEIKKSDACGYIKYLRCIYIPTQGVSEMLEVQGGETEESASLAVSFSDFVTMFDDRDWGFGVMLTLVKLENGLWTKD